MKGLPRAAEPGAVWNYNTGETFVAGAVLEGATHQSAATYLSETIWSRLGMEQDATWWLESPGGMVYAGGGIAATLRDYGRFGRFFLSGGVAQGTQVLPPGWVTEASSPKILKGGKPADYGYFWWPAWPTKDNPDPHGAFAANGIFGQFIYVSPKEHLVIVVLSARSKPVDMDTIDDMDFFAAAAIALH
jgi:hypothetical protein